MQRDVLRRWADGSLHNSRTLMLTNLSVVAYGACDTQDTFVVRTESTYKPARSSCILHRAHNDGARQLATAIMSEAKTTSMAMSTMHPHPIVMIDLPPPVMISPFAMLLLPQCYSVVTPYHRRRAWMTAPAHLYLFTLRCLHDTEVDFVHEAAITAGVLELLASWCDPDT